MYWLVFVVFFFFHSFLKSPLQRTRVVVFVLLWLFFYVEIFFLASFQHLVMNPRYETFCYGECFVYMNKCLYYNIVVRGRMLSRVWFDGYLNLFWFFYTLPGKNVLFDELRRRNISFRFCIISHTRK